MTSSPVLVLAVRGVGAIAMCRKMMGATFGSKAEPGTIRGDFVLDSYLISDTDGRSVRNLIHASGSVKEAEREIKHWFKASELIKYRLIQEQVLYDVNLDGLLE